VAGEREQALPGRPEDFGAGAPAPERDPEVADQRSDQPLTMDLTKQ
jgi:hypothetical protein